MIADQAAEPRQRRDGGARPTPRPTVVVVTGMSGSGKSTAARALEDLGYFCVDNLPATLLPQLLALCEATSEVQRLAVVMDTRGGAFGSAPASVVRNVRRQAPVEVLFLEARDEILIRRFSETRRRHPLFEPGLPLATSIARERQLLLELRSDADHIVDTSEMNVHQLRKRVVDRYAEPGAGSMTIVTMSFGYKFGLPAEADYVLDARHLPNPHFVEELAALSGLDAPVRAWLEARPATGAWLERIDALLDFAVPRHDNEGKVLLTVAVGCTGGRHRSVFVAEAIARRLRRRGHRVHVFHRDVDRS